MPAHQDADQHQRDFKTESERAAQTVSQLARYQEELSSALNYMGEENLKKLKDLRDSAEANPTDLFLFMEQLHAQNLAFNLKDKVQRLEELAFSLAEPYFSRIDLADAKNLSSEIIYIGKFGFTPKNTSKPVITDWRAKIASVYYKYRYPQANVTYETQDGEVVRDLKLKRTFEFDAGALVKFYNNDIQLDENELIAEKIAKRTGGVLEDIVATIQQSQMAIIEQDPRSICIVQGCVGSGKSTVAIHKLSHIFFNFPKLIAPHNSLLVAKNQILTGYLSTLFPKLGIFDINYGTLKDLIVRIVYRHELPVDLSLDNESNMSDCDATFVHTINNSSASFKSFVCSQLDELQSDSVVSRYFTFVYDDELSALENVSSLLMELDEELRFQKDKIDGGVSGSYEAKCQENIKNLRQITTKLKKIARTFKTSVFPKVLRSLDLKSTKKLCYKDALTYIVLYAEAFGLSNLKKFEYCVVDEGQDFSLLEYLFLNKVVIKGRFSILGDLNQGYIESGIKKWEEIQEAIPDAHTFAKFELTTNYRSTKQIIDYACNILAPYTTSYLPKSINRRGLEVGEMVIPNKDMLFSDFQKRVQTDLTALDKSVGVICFSDYLFEKAKAFLESGYRAKLKDRLVVLNPKDKIFYAPKGVYLTMFENCKGLEFSKVYVLGLKSSFKNLSEARAAYVASTRAMNELIVYKIND